MCFNQFVLYFFFIYFISVIFVPFIINLYFARMVLLSWNLKQLETTWLFDFLSLDTNKEFREPDLQASPSFSTVRHLSSTCHILWLSLVFVWSNITETTLQLSLELNLDCWMEICGIVLAKGQRPLQIRKEGTEISHVKYLKLLSF